MKVSIEQIEATLLERKIEPPKVQEIIKDLEQAAEEEKADRQANAGPKAKWEHIIFINDPENKVGKEFTGWVVKMQQGMDAGLITGKLNDGAKEQNESSKRKKNLIKSFGELFAYLKPKFLKDKGVKIATKEAVRIIPVNGKTL
jgi:hypothetical protein